MLSWGENVPEVVATLTLARAGQGTMALAACFAGPMFNLAVRETLTAGLASCGLIQDVVCMRHTACLLRHRVLATLGPLTTWQSVEHRCWI